MDQDSTQVRKTFTLFDLLLIIFLLAAGLGFFFLQRSRSGGDKVLVWSDNELLVSFNLKENNRFVVSNDLGTNTVVIENGQAFVVDADCPDKICEQMEAISKPGETIVCLPHKLVVEVSDEK